MQGGHEVLRKEKKDFWAIFNSLATFIVSI